MTQLAKRLQHIQPSITLGISARANELRRQGVDIINLSVGEPDFPTPEHIQNAAIKAMHDGLTKYTPVDGIPELKSAIAHKFQRDNALTLTEQQVIASCGAKQSLYNLFQALLNPDDEVIIPAPYWPSYPEMVRLSEGKPVIISTTIEQHYKMTANQLEEAITDKTRLLILNSPSNPTGMVYDQNELKELANVLLNYPDIFIVSDDIYEYINWHPEPFVNIFMTAPELLERGVIVNGVSKAYAMTGWRIGYAGGPLPIIQGMKKLQSQSTSNPCSIAQAAAVAAINSDQDCVKTMTTTFKKRHDYMIEALNEVNDLHCIPSHGAFYLFINAEEAIDKLGLSDDVELTNYLLDNAKIAVVPGTAMGAPNHIRLSYATSDKNLSSAIERLKETLK